MGGCMEGTFWDGLVQRCLPCEMVCQHANTHTHAHARCSDYCASHRCRATAGHFYDQLLKKCFSCGQVCGSHPPECVTECQAQTTAVSAVVSPVVEAAGPGVSSRGSSVLGVCVLGACVALIICSISLLLLLLLHRRHTATRGQQRAEQPQQHAHQKGQDVEGQQWCWATETCVHCFPESGKATPTPHRLAGFQNPTSNGPLLLQDNCCHANVDSPKQQSEKHSPSPVHIICSPEQNSL
ncbi:tumor necrosis factor receptor superfamily member 13B [Alosa sapidissima]|uniref:tumor necrosis factor receptor superfamily member 13B n=1 Tax=Alosa sapidissima TaxID=34773 RepID=UPI001C08883D|nr:tumor necrosis factor receptor superfamily member 13B [Alosa sapidissima]